MLLVTVEDRGNNVILHCEGRIVRGYETAILCAAVRHAGRNIILDLSQVEAIDAAGVGALISLQAAGIYLQLLDPVKAVREVLKITGLESVFEILTSGEEENDEEENNMVRKGGFEPPCLSAPPPQDGVSASSTTSAT
jgi:anti-anti-sigma factor